MGNSSKPSLTFCGWFWLVTGILQLITGVGVLWTDTAAGVSNMAVGTVLILLAVWLGRKPPQHIHVSIKPERPNTYHPQFYQGLPQGPHYAPPQYYQALPQGQQPHHAPPQYYQALPQGPHHAPPQYYQANGLPPNNNQGWDHQPQGKQHYHAPNA